MSPAVERSLCDLTPRQREIYEFLKDQIMNHGIPPTVREIGNRFKIKSPNGVSCHLLALIRKGLITKKDNLSRSITLVDSPKRATAVKHLGSFDLAGGKLTVGKLAAIDFMDLLGTGDHFAYTVAKDTKEYAKGDIVICRKQQFYKPGTMTVLLTGKELKLREFSENLDPAKATVEAAVVGFVRKIA